MRKYSLSVALRFCVILLSACVAMTAFAGTAAAEDFGGRWEGTGTYYSFNWFGEQCYRITATCSLVIWQSGDTITDGVLDMTVTKEEKLPISLGMYVPVVGYFNSQIKQTTMQGAILAFRTTFESWTFTLTGGQLVGSCQNLDTNVYLGISSDANAFTLTHTGGGPGSLGSGSALSTVAVGLAVAAAVVGVAASLLPAPQSLRMPSMQAPQSRRTPRWQAPMTTSYQEGSASQMNVMETGPPVADTYMGGIGMTGGDSNFDQNGRPYPPSDPGRYITGNEPRCPIHNIPCRAKFLFQNQLEPGSWFCPRCADLRSANGGFPWGINRP